MAAHDEAPFRREAALHALGAVPDGGADRIAQIADLARHERVSEVRETAAVALGELGDRSPGAVARTAARTIVDQLRDETEPRVKACLLYALRDTREQPVADAVLAALADPDSMVRLAAADVLGDVAAAHRQTAVATLAARFEQETDPDLRNMIVTAIVRAGRISALPVLEKLHGGDQQPLIDDFVAGLRDGEDNMEKLYALRAARMDARK
jgi:HEAT repeat protein